MISTTVVASHCSYSCFESSSIVSHQFLLQIVGPRDTSVPQAGLDTEVRGSPIAQAIVDVIVANPDLDPSLALLYNPINWRDASNEFFQPSDDFYDPAVEKTINGRPDAFSQRYGFRGDL